MRQKCAVVPRRARIRDPKTLVSLSLRLKDLLGPVTRVKKEKKKMRETLCALSSLLFLLAFRRHKFNQIVFVYCFRYMSWEVLENIC